MFIWNLRNVSVFERENVSLYSSEKELSSNSFKLSTWLCPFSNFPPKKLMQTLRLPFWYHSLWWKWIHAYTGYLEAYNFLSHTPPSTSYCSVVDFNSSVNWKEISKFLGGEYISTGVCVVVGNVCEQIAGGMKVCHVLW